MDVFWSHLTRCIVSKIYQYSWRGSLYARVYVCGCIAAQNEAWSHYSKPDYRHYNSILWLKIILSRKNWENCRAILWSISYTSTGDKSQYNWTYPSLPCLLSVDIIRIMLFMNVLICKLYFLSAFLAEFEIRISLFTAIHSVPKQLFQNSRRRHCSVTKHVFQNSRRYYCSVSKRVRQNPWKSHVFVFGLAVLRPPERLRVKKNHSFISTEFVYLIVRYQCDRKINYDSVARTKNLMIVIFAKFWM